jgi:hypothetical protein
VQKAAQRIDSVLARPGTAGQLLSVEQAFVTDVPVDGLASPDHSPRSPTSPSDHQRVEER